VGIQIFVGAEGSDRRGDRGPKRRGAETWSAFKENGEAQGQAEGRITREKGIRGCGKQVCHKTVKGEAKKGEWRVGEEHPEIRSVGGSQTGGKKSGGTRCERQEIWEGKRGVGEGGDAITWEGRWFQTGRWAR